jgi:hypothetical protein
MAVVMIVSVVSTDTADGVDSIEAIAKESDFIDGIPLRIEGNTLHRLCARRCVMNCKWDGGHHFPSDMDYVDCGGHCADVRVDGGVVSYRIPVYGGCRRFRASRRKWSNI